MRFPLTWLSLAALLILDGTSLIPGAAAQATAQDVESSEETTTLLSVEGVLEAGDAVLEQDGSLYDTYSFEGQAGQTVRISMKSAEFDPFVWLFDPQDEQLAQNDDFGDMTLSAGMVITLPEDGQYTLVANAHNAENQGRYQIEVILEPGQDAPALSD